MSYHRGYDDYRGYGGGGYDDRRGFGGGGGRSGGWGGDRDRRGGRDDGYRGSGGWDGGRDRGNFGGGDRRDRAFGGGGGGGRNFDRRGGGRGGGGGGRGGGGGNRGQKRPGGGNSGPPPKKKDDNNWDQDDRHKPMPFMYMESKPENFEEEWVFTVCPAGKRRIIVAADEITQSYNSSGQSDGKFNSCLPNGNEAFNEVHKLQDLTVLDTMLNSGDKKCYIIDMMHWRHYPYYDTEADFRFYCLADKYAELKNPTETNGDNEYSLHLLPKLPCSDSSIDGALQQAKTDSLKVEGLLFIKKSSLYDSQDSNNSMWLRLDKMQDVLGYAPPEGLEFEESSSRDERKKQEQEEWQKVKEQRDAVTKEAQEKLQEDQTERSEETNRGDADMEAAKAGVEPEAEANEQANEEYTGDNYTATGEQGDVWV